MMQLGVYDELFSIFDELIILPKDSFKLNCRKPDGNIIHCIVAFISFPIWYLMFLFLSILGASLIIISSDRKPIILPKRLFVLKQH